MTASVLTQDPNTQKVEKNAVYLNLFVYLDLVCSNLSSPGHSLIRVIGWLLTNGKQKKVG